MSSFQHRNFAAFLATTLAVTATLAGCAGNGNGLNSQGLPGDSTGTLPLSADFESIQENVFTPICSPCHSGASAPEGLMLDASHSYNLLVGVQSTEVPSLSRVSKGDPDSSYIIIKLTNGPGIVGNQMPLHETPLPTATIDFIKQWITNGAPPAAATPAATANAMQKIQRLAATAPDAFDVAQTWPLDQTSVATPVRQIVVAFTHEVDASLVNYTTLTVERVGSRATSETDAAMDTAIAAQAQVDAPTVALAQPVLVPSYTALAAGNPNAVVITPVAPLVPGTYQVTVRSSDGSGLADLNAQGLGADYSFTFNVDASP